MSRRSSSIGFMYRTARGVTRDFEQAAEYYYPAPRGPAGRAHAIAKLYEEGWGVPQSYDQGLRWYSSRPRTVSRPRSIVSAVMYQRGWGVDVDLRGGGAVPRVAAALGLGQRDVQSGQAVRQRRRRAAGHRTRRCGGSPQATEEGNAYAPYHWAGLLRDGKRRAEGPAARACALLSCRPIAASNGRSGRSPTCTRRAISASPT